MSSMPNRVFRLQAPVTAESLGMLHSSAEAAVAEGALELTIDVDGVERLDSPAIATLIKVLRMARAAGGSVDLAVTRPPLLDTLRITALDRVFSIVKTPAFAGWPVPAVSTAPRGRSAASR